MPKKGTSARGTAWLMVFGGVFVTRASLWRIGHFRNFGLHNAFWRCGPAFAPRLVSFGDRIMEEQSATLEMLLDLDARQEELLRQLDELDRRIQQTLMQLAEANRTEKPDS